MANETIEIIDETDENRFGIHVDGVHAGHADYRKVDSAIVFTHTSIDDEFGGRGLGTQLVTAALASASEQGLKVAPLCPFFASHIEENPDSAVVDHELLERLRREHSQG